MGLLHGFFFVDEPFTFLVGRVEHGVILGFFILRHRW